MEKTVSMGAQNLQYLLDETGIGQSEFARIVGATKDQVYNYVNDRSSIPTETIKKIVQLVGSITYDEFLNKDLSKLKKKMILVIKQDAPNAETAELVKELKEIIRQQKETMLQQKQVIDLLTRQVKKK